MRRQRGLRTARNAAAVATSLGATSALVTALACGCSPPPPSPEAQARAEWVRKLAMAEDAGAAWSLTSRHDVYFDDGWNPMETMRGPGVRGEVWRWMGRTSVTKLRGRNVPMRIVLQGSVPMELLGAPPMVTLRWNGVRVGAFIPPFGRFRETVVIPANVQQDGAFGDFTIDTSTVGQERGDPRELGFSLADLSWEPASP
jgi:hypothetical protein